jgi:hypothetical protein
MAKNQIANALRTLLVSGYDVTSVTRISQSATLIAVRKGERLGGVAATTILLVDNPSASAVEMLKRAAQQNQSQPLAVSTNRVAGLKTMKPDEFFEVLGGESRSDRLIRDDLAEVLDRLGHNVNAPEFVGSAERFLEDYIKEGLEFLMESRGWHYGQDRIFESVPDGIVLGRNNLNLYFDGKAYKKGYHPSADDIKRFAGYVNDFNDRYAVYVGRIHSFLVVSGSFTKKKDALANKASDFYALCKTQLCHITAKNFGQIVTDIRVHCANRSAIKWANVFSQLQVEPKSIAAELRRVNKDKVVD